MIALEKTLDIREDSEQVQKGDEILELLVAAGYYRARIKVGCGDCKILCHRQVLYRPLVVFQGIETFDKVVGGLVWCIETCDFDVDILLFQEDW